MKNDSFLTRSMDVPGEDGSHNNAINSLKEFGDSSDYNEALEEDEKTNDNVNTTALGWPLRHNNDAGNLAYTCNGFRQIKKPCFTYAGRISRVPSRYLDTDSDSGGCDGSVRDDVVSRLKVKRRRKLKRSSTTHKKSLVNGFKEHDEKLSLNLNSIRTEEIICNLNEQTRENLTNLDCSEVLEVSPVSEDNISYIAHEAQARTFFPINNTPSEAIGERGRVFEVNLNGILDSNQDSVSELGLKDASSLCCLEATVGCVDISTENKGLPRFVSRMVSPDPSLTQNSCDNETSNECKRGHCLNDLSTTQFSYAPCKRTLESCDSSTKDTFVSSIQNSKQRKVSCASLVSTNSDASSQKGNGDICCFESGELSSANGCLASRIEPIDELEPDAKLDLVKEDVLSEACCLEKSEILADKLQKETAKDQSNEEDCGFKPKGLNCFKNFNMKRNYYTNKKLNQKQLRRTERVNSNSGLKNHGVINQLKRKSVNKVEKAVKMKKNINLDANEKPDVQNVNAVKTTFSPQELDRVLGMRRNCVGVYEFLVQWTNGTSCWVSSDQIVSNKHNCILREYLVENEQDVSVINRIPFQAYCCDSLSLKECKPEVKTKKVKKMLLGKACPAISRKSIKKKEVSVENDGDHCYITVNRESCLRKLTCVKIITELITALEDASVSECELVIIKGLGSKVFGGLNLETISKASAEEKGNMMLSKMRYLVQTLCNYPKPLVGLISKPAEGIGAVFLSLFDLIWDEDAWKKMKSDENLQELSEDTSSYSLPRVLGHSGPSEEIFMGKKCEHLQPPHPSSFSKITCDENSHHSMVMSTHKEVETTLQNLGKRTSLLDINGEDIFKMEMNQSSDSAHVPGAIATCNSAVESEIDSLTVDTDSNCWPSTSSAPADRYVKELESQILQEKQMAQKYFEEIMSIWKDPSSVY